MVDDAGCERIHKEKKGESKDLFTFQEGKGAWCGEIHEQQNVGELSLYWIIKGVGVIKLCGPWAVRGITTGSFLLVLHKLQFAPVLSFACSSGGQLFRFCSCFPVICNPVDISSEE